MMRSPYSEPVTPVTPELELYPPDMGNVAHALIWLWLKTQVPWSSHHNSW
jgi:hypothetical protein